jgi:hypothetical protein
MPDASVAGAPVSERLILSIPKHTNKPFTLNKRRKLGGKNIFTHGLGH